MTPKETSDQVLWRDHNGERGPVPCIGGSLHDWGHTVVMAAYVDAVDEAMERAAVLGIPTSEAIRQTLSEMNEAARS